MTLKILQHIYLNTANIMFKDCIKVNVNIGYIVKFMFLVYYSMLKILKEDRSRKGYMLFLIFS